MSIDELRQQLMYQEAADSLRACGLDPDKHLGADQWTPVCEPAASMPAGWVCPDWRTVLAPGEEEPIGVAVPTLVVESGSYRCACVLKKHLDEASPGWRPSVCQPMPWPKKPIEVPSKSSSSTQKRRAPKRSPPEQKPEDQEESPHQHT